jgi:DNA polymerase (family X)
MKNHEIAVLFGRIADLLEISGENVYRVNSYRNAARILDELTDDVEGLLAGGSLQELPGIGERTSQKIKEYLETGTIGLLDELSAKVPPRLADLLKIPGLGPKTVALAWKKLGVEDIEGLQKAIGTGKLEKLAGMGTKKVENIRRGIQFLAQSAGRTPLGTACPRAMELIEQLRKIPGVRQAQIAGSLRRWMDTIGDIDLVIEAEDGEAALKTFTKLSHVHEVLALGDTKASVRIADNIQVDVRVVPKESFGAAWLYFSGSKAHNIHLREIAIRKKWKLNEYGLYAGKKQIAGETEESVYEKLGLGWIAPELREDRGEIDRWPDLPALIEENDIRGDLHMHTKASDGRCEMEELVEACLKRGYKYLCISDHSASSRVANGLDARRMAAQIRNVRKLRDKYARDILILAGSEVDILADGTLDYEDALLADLDFVLASLHSGLNQPMERGTARVLRAMDNPHVRAIGHLTGRIIGQREPAKLDIPALLTHAAHTGTWLELNAAWQRLDLSDYHCRLAREAGAKVVINTDAHDIPQLNNMVYGVHTARRGWLEAKDVVNALPADKMVELLKREKEALVPF